MSSPSIHTIVPGSDTMKDPMYRPPSTRAPSSLPAQLLNDRSSPFTHSVSYEAPTLSLQGQGFVFWQVQYRSIYIYDRNSLSHIFNTSTLAGRISLSVVFSLSSGTIDIKLHNFLAFPSCQNCHRTCPGFLDSDWLDTGCSSLQPSPQWYTAPYISWPGMPPSPHPWNDCFGMSPRVF